MILITPNLWNQPTRTGITSRGSSQMFQRKFSATKKIKGWSISATKPGKSLRKIKDKNKEMSWNWSGIDSWSSWNLQRARKKIQRLSRRDWRKYFDGLAEEAQSEASMWHISKVYKTINKLSCKPAHSRVPVKDNAETLHEETMKQGWLNNVSIFWVFARF